MPSFPIKTTLKVFLFTFFTTILIACSGGGSSGPAPGPTTGIVNGTVFDNATGSPVSGATVSIAGTTTSTTTAADGTYTLTGISATSRAVINISANTYASASKVTAVFANNTSRVDAAMLPVTFTQTITNLAVPQTIAVPNSTATVALPANGLQTTAGTAPSGAVTVNVTTIDPSSNPQIMPGDFSTDTGGLLESYGAIDVTMSDANGTQVNLAAGNTSTIRIPVAAGSTPQQTMGLWHYDQTTGQWINGGTLNLFGVAPNQYYEGTVPHFSTWNADQAMNTTCVTGRVVNANGSPAANARITSEGQGYIGTSTAYSNPDGTFSINIKANASAIVSASNNTSQSNSQIAFGGPAGTTCLPMLNDLVLGSASTGAARIRLSWGVDPGDLDSHLTGPDGLGGRFHVAYYNLGSINAAPFASLDVDDVTSFGPEVVTIGQFLPGTYRYSVHHFSGLGTILSSPARVELTLNGATRIFTPPACATVAMWVVMELVVDNAGNVTVTPINTCSTLQTVASTGGGFKAGKPKPVGIQ